MEEVCLLYVILFSTSVCFFFFIFHLKKDIKFSLSASGMIIVVFWIIPLTDKNNNMLVKLYHSLGKFNSVDGKLMVISLFLQENRL